MLVEIGIKVAVAVAAFTFPFLSVTEPHCEQETVLVVYCVTVIKGPACVFVGMRVVIQDVLTVFLPDFVKVEQMLERVLVECSTTVTMGAALTRVGVVAVM